jgi:hypothetical protein
MDDFQDGVPPATNEQPTQDRWANMTPEDRFLMETFERDENFRQNARALYHQVQAGQYQPQQQNTQQPRQEDSIAAKERELAQVEAERIELVRIWKRGQRNATPEEEEKWVVLDRREDQLKEEISRLKIDEAYRTSQQAVQQASVGQFQQQVGQRFAQFAQPRIQQMNVPAAKKTELYNRMWQIFTSHPFYPQIVDIQAADELMKFAYNELVVNHGAPKQRVQGGGRTDERYNDIETPQEDGPKDRFADLPPEVASQLRSRYGNRPVN